MKMIADVPGLAEAKVLHASLLVLLKLWFSLIKTHLSSSGNFIEHLLLDSTLVLCICILKLSDSWRPKHIFSLVYQDCKAAYVLRAKPWAKHQIDFGYI